MKERRIEDMKREYDAYPVPGEALDRIKEGISRAEKEGNGMKQRVCRIIKTMGISAAAAMAAITLLANSGEHTARAMEQIPVIGAIARVVTFREYHDVNNGFEADIEIPRVTDENAENQAMLEEVNKSIEEYVRGLIGMYESEQQTTEGEGHYHLQSSYEVICDNERYLSIRINSLLVMAGGTEFVKIFNVDKETGEVVTLKTLCGSTEDYISAISENIIKQMKERMAEDEGVKYFITAEGDPFGFSEITEDSNFYINEKGELVIVFDEYEVAPGSMGVVEFTIPKDVAEIR